MNEDLITQSELLEALKRYNSAALAEPTKYIDIYENANADDSAKSQVQEIMRYVNEVRAENAQVTESEAING